MNSTVPNPGFALPPVEPPVQAVTGLLQSLQLLFNMLLHQVEALLPQTPPPSFHLIHHT